MDFDVAFYIAQAISIINTGIAMFSAQMKNMKAILFTQILANVIAAATCLLLGGLSGVGVSIIAVIQTVVMYFYNANGKKPNVAVTAVFILAYVLNAVFTFSTAFDVFPAIAAVCFALAVAQTKPMAYRFFSIWNPLSWLVYDIYIGAYVNIIMHVGIFVSIIIACFRLDGFFGLIKKETTKN